MLEDLATYDNSIWQKVKSWITKAIKNIKAVYKNLSPNSQAAQVLSETMTDMDKLERLFTEGVREAGERAAEDVTRMNEENMQDSDKIYSLSKSKEQGLKESLRKLGEKRIRKEAGSKTITILTDEFTANKNIYSSKGRSSNEVNARIKYIPMFDKLIKQSVFDGTDTEIRGLEKEAKKGVVAIHKFVTEADGYSVEILVRDKGDKQYLYEVKFIKTKKNPQQSMTDKSAFPAPEGDAEDGEIIPRIEETVNSKSSISDDSLVKKYPNLDLNQDISNMDGVPAIQLEDGSVLTFTEPHVTFIQDNGIDVEDIRSGGWIADGVYEPSEQSDTLRYKERMLAKKRMDEKRATKKYSIDDSAEVSGSEAADNQAALERFGTTTDFEQAGFAMADGRMLKLSQYGQRGVQHRVIEGIYEDTKGDEAIARFIQNGNVRISAASPGIEISAEKPLTTNQLNVISRFASKSLAERERSIKTRSKKELNP